jgi:signal transduction histidine kinase
VELALYRIAQEALNNVARHAKANRATLHIVFAEEIRLEVADNGVGFQVPRSPTEFAHGGHFGLLGMRERADLIGARLEVQSGQSLAQHPAGAKEEAGGGTRLSVRLTIPPGGSQKGKKG